MVAAARCPLHGIGLGVFPWLCPRGALPAVAGSRPGRPLVWSLGVRVGSGLDSGLESAPGDQMSARSWPFTHPHCQGETDTQTK